MELRREDGIALLVVILAMLLMTALAAAVLLTTSSETIIAANFRSSVEGLYAADAALERVIDGLQGVPDWSLLLGGLEQSAFVDGAAGGSRTLSDSSLINLGEVVNLANCQKTTACSTAEMDAVTPERPWGALNPRWVLYGYGPLTGVLNAGTVSSAFYVVVLVGGSVSQDIPASGALAMRAEAFGPRGAHKVIESTLARADAGVRMLSWRAVR